jgi:hypothetical protein
MNGDGFANASFAAWSITAATFAGSSRMTMWQVGRVVVTAPIFFAADASIAGGTMRSFAEITAHVGLVFHAATVSFSSNIGP